MELKDVLHLHLGVRGELRFKRRHMLMKDYNDGDTVWLSCDVLEAFKLEALDFKPHLSYLCDMTEEQAIEIAKICFETYGYRVEKLKDRWEVWGYDKEDIPQLESEAETELLQEDAENNDCMLTIYFGRLKTVEFYNGREDDYFKVWDQKTMFKITAYLLSQGFDLFGLIDSKQASNAKKLQA